MSYSSFERESARRVRRCRLLLEVAGTFHTITIFQWTTVMELKQIVSNLFSVPIPQQSLFYGEIELANSHLLDDYRIFDINHVDRKIIVNFKQDPNIFIRISPGCSNSAITSLVSEVNRGLALGLTPTLTMEGTGGTYFLRDAKRAVRAIFKPLDEEAFAPNNPKGYLNRMGSRGFRSGVLSGEAGYREVAAYLLDHKGFSNVPPTTIAEAQHVNFCYKVGSKQVDPYPKLGSLQAFVTNLGSCDNYSPSMYSKQEVHKIAILDMRLLNMDRNEGNILVLDGYKLVPIDHGLSIPSSLDITEYDLCWMNWPHSKDSLSPAMVEYVKQLDPLKDIETLKNSLPFRDVCLRNIRIAGMLLKKGVEAGMSLYEIGCIMYRQGYEESPSELENIISKAQEIYSSIQKSLIEKLKLQKYLKDLMPKESPVPKRSRAFSENELELICSTMCSSSSSPGSKDSPRNLETEGSENCSEIFLTISEISEEEDEPLYAMKTKPRRRSISVPSSTPLSPRETKKQSYEEAFNTKLFYYIEAFMDAAIKCKLNDSKGNLYTAADKQGRFRSYSLANY
jgi:hypothetical protein